MPRLWQPVDGQTDLFAVCVEWADDPRRGLCRGGPALLSRARQILHIPSSTHAACYAVLHERGIDVGYPKAPILPIRHGIRAATIAEFRQMDLL
jgi:hypothetical protein